MRVRTLGAISLSGAVLRAARRRCDEPTADHVRFRKTSGLTADAMIPLDGPDGPFTRLITNGIRADLPTEIEIPSGEALAALLNYWDYSVNRP